MSDGILKKTVERLVSLTPVSRENMIEAVRHILVNFLVHMVDSHNTNSAIFVFVADDCRYVLKAEYATENVTSREVGWYKTAPINSSIPPLLASFSNNNYAFLIMQYIENTQTLDELTVAGVITADKLAQYIEKALLKDQQLFAQSKPTTTSFVNANQFYLEKYKKRAAEAHTHQYLRALLESTDIHVNGKLMHSPAYYLAIISRNPSLRQYLFPNMLGLIHGDLHSGNILVDQNQDKIYFIDPNGTLRMPIEYDYGKILHSIHGGYNEIMNGHYTLVVSNNSYRFDFIVPEIYDTALKRVQKQLNDQDYLRGLFAEAMHFATLLPHHAARQDETTALFLRCIYIFEDLFYNLNIRWT